MPLGLPVSLRVWAGVVIAIGLLAASFTAGNMLASYAGARKLIAEQEVGAANTAHNIEAKAAADVRQQDSILSYHKGVEADDVRTKELLSSMLVNADWVCNSTCPAEHTAPAAPRNTCGAERKEVARLSGQLRSTLEKYGAEANRANQYTRLLNECIGQLYRDRELDAAYR